MHFLFIFNALLLASSMTTPDSNASVQSKQGAMEKSEKKETANKKDQKFQNSEKESEVGRRGGVDRDDREGEFRDDRDGYYYRGNRPKNYGYSYSEPEYYSDDGDGYYSDDYYYGPRRNWRFWSRERDWDGREESRKERRHGGLTYNDGKGWQIEQTDFGIGVGVPGAGIYVGWNDYYYPYYDGYYYDGYGPYHNGYYGPYYGPYYGRRYYGWGPGYGWRARRWRY